MANAGSAAGYLWRRLHGMHIGHGIMGKIRYICYFSFIHSIQNLKCKVAYKYRDMDLQ